MTGPSHVPETTCTVPQARAGLAIIAAAKAIADAPAVSLALFPEEVRIVPNAFLIVFSNSEKSDEAFKPAQ